MGGLVTVAAKPKFELGVTASITAGVNLWLKSFDHTWGPWEKPLGAFGRDMQLSAGFPVAWNEKTGLDLDADKTVIERPSLDATEIMKDAFDMLV